MTTFYKGVGGSVTMTPGQLPKAIARVVKTIMRGANKGGKRSLNDIKTIIQDGIRTNSLGLNPLKDSTIAARRMGKDSGNTPAKPRKFGTSPLNYSGETLKGIRVSMNGDMLNLGFDESARISYSSMQKGMAAIATEQEYGFTIRGTYTKKMLAYLHVLFKKQFGEKEHRRKSFVQGRKDLSNRGVKVGMSYTRKVDPRPAWERATLKSFPIVEINFRTAILKELQKAGLLIEQS